MRNKVSRAALPSGWAAIATQPWRIHLIHTVSIRSDMVETHPWLPQAVFRAYSEARQEALDFERKHAWYEPAPPSISQQLEETRAVRPG